MDLVGSLLNPFLAYVSYLRLWCLVWRLLSMLRVVHCVRQPNLLTVKVYR